MKTIISKVYELTGPRTLNVREEPINLGDIGSNDIVAETIVSVISPGTEVAAYIGLPPLRPMKVYPRVNGYCNVASVLAVGKNVVDIKVGDRVSTHQSHRSAFRCHRSKVNSVLKPGDDAVSHATLYLWHLGYYPLIRSKAVAGMNVAIIGLGTLGLASVGAANLAGCNVIAVSDREWARQKAKDLGAKYMVSKKGLRESKSELEQATLGMGVDLVISTSNDWDDWRLALDIARDGGSIAIVGFPGRGTSLPEFNPLASQYIYDKELTIYACGNPPACDVSARDVRFNLSRNYLYLDEMIRTNRIDGRKLVSEIGAWTELDSIYKRMADREPGLLTVALDWAAG